MADPDFQLSESELVVQEALDNILEKKKLTTVVVAHRLSTIRNCDIINVLVYGELLESGTHDDLMKKGGYYKTLVEKQDGTKNNSESNSALSSRNNSAVDLKGLGDTTETKNVASDGIPGVPHIQFRNVKFAYPTRPKKLIFDGFNLDIEQGSTVALVGPSGLSFLSLTQHVQHYEANTQTYPSLSPQVAENRQQWVSWKDFTILSRGLYHTMDITCGH